MAMSTLEKLMGGGARVRAIRFFLQNPDRVVTTKEFAKLAGVSATSARREIQFLRGVELISLAKRIDEIIYGENL